MANQPHGSEKWMHQPSEMTGWTAGNKLQIIAGPVPSKAKTLPIASLMVLQRLARPWTCHSFSKGHIGRPIARDWTVLLALEMKKPWPFYKPLAADGRENHDGYSRALTKQRWRLNVSMFCKYRPFCAVKQICWWPQPKRAKWSM